MFYPTDEVIAKVLFEKTSDDYDFPHEKLSEHLKELDGKIIKTLSNKNVQIKIVHNYSGLSIETATLKLHNPQCEFEKFCDCFPFNTQICYDDLQMLLTYEKKFRNGVMSPVGLYGLHGSHIKNNNVFERLDLYYGISLAWINEENRRMNTVFDLLLENHQTPIIFQCLTDEEWQTFLSQYEPVIIDVTQIKNRELFGTNWCARKIANVSASGAKDFWEEYHKAIYFEPDWLKKLNMKKRKVLVLTNFDKVPYKDVNPTDLAENDYCPFERNDEVIFGQSAYLFLMRNSNEADENRELNTNSPYKFPLDATTIIIQKPNPKYQIVEPIMSRAYIFQLNV